MSYLVVDASVAAAICLEEPDAEYLQSILATARDDGIIVPVVWPLEVSNVLRTAVRRGRISAVDVMDSAAALLEYPIFVSQTTLAYGLRETLRIALEHGLTSYDATYLDLAWRRHLPLVTLDRELAAAARAIGVRVLPDA